MSEQELSIKMQSIINRIKQRRIELHMSYQDLANKTGLSKSTLQRYETGTIKNMPLDKLEDLSKALNVKPSYLMGWSEKPQEPPQFTKQETAHIYKYRSIDDKGKHTVDTVLEMEYNRCKKPYLLVNAAHAIEGASEEDKQHDDELMNNDDLWK